MRTLILVFLVAVLGSSAKAQDYSGCGGWSFHGETRFGMDTWESHSDGLDQDDHLAAPSQGGWIAGSYRVYGQDSWDGNTGFYSYDERAPLQLGQNRGHG